MPKETIEIPVPVLSSVESLDELLDWLTTQNPKIMAELREARRQDVAGEFRSGNRAMSHGLPSRSKPEGRRSTK